ncbi:MAG: hypothetical protein GY726_14075, partial [Proteobacteria bacterium]|nr:hypothetical protein [Pseudomonadota bacterium]
MRHDVTFPVLPDLSTIDFSRTTDLQNLARERIHHLFGGNEDACIDEFVDATQDFFAGRQSGYQPMDTPYHDITHTLQATLCLVELLHNRHIAEATPRLEAGHFKLALVAELFHDIGYLKLTGDTQGSGAKYTHEHEKRSCNFARAFLEQQDWTSKDIKMIENLINATGPTANLSRMEFGSEIEHELGKMVCTADYIGQMSDPNYPDKLEALFHEFKESYQYQGLLKDEWPFASYEQLLRSTPDFWGIIMHKKLSVECSNLCRYLKHPISGENPYLESIERNLAEIQKRIT